MKLFTLEEAQALLPVLESLLKRAIEAKQEAEAITDELQKLVQRIFLMGGLQVDGVRVARRRSEAEALVERAKQALAEIDSAGVQVKDLDIGLLDFPFKLDDDIVLLCWKVGEPRITHWHTIDSGFRGRQPLDERFGRIKPERPN